MSKLTKAEEQLMQTVWEIGKAGLKDITDAMPNPKPHSNTVATVLKILAEKGYIEIEQIGRINLYSPKISKEEYSVSSIKDFAKMYFNGSFNSIVSLLVEKNKISIDDLEELIKNIKK